MKSVGAMVKQLVGMIGTNDLTKWERDFMERVGITTGDGEHTRGLSWKQVEIIERLYAQHFGDAS